MHGYLGHDGRSPAEFLAAGREEVRSYGGQVLAGRAIDTERIDGGHVRVHVTGGHSVVARRLVIATGLVDVLPEVEGLAGLWGDRVIHCPFCHGFEFRDRRIVQLVDHPLALHAALLYRQLTNRLTLLIDHGVELDDAQRDRWLRAGVDVRRGSAVAVTTRPDAELVVLTLADGEHLEVDAVAVTTRVRARVEPFAALGVRTAAHPSGLGDVLSVDGSGATGVSGVWAAGNVADPSQHVAQATANGSWVGAMVSFDLAEEDFAAGARPSAVETDWDGRYSGAQVWSGNPNGALVAEAAALEPGRALDVGAGEGGDAIWLAERGWKVTASDVSAKALDRIAVAACERGLAVECLRADANDLEPYPSAAFDLVTAHYASILRSRDDRGITNLLDAVAPGGTLLVVNHDPEPMRAPIDTATHTRGYDADAYISIDHIVEHLAASPDWEIVVHETRPRGPGTASASHHVDDVVLRARRAST